MANIDESQSSRTMQAIAALRDAGTTGDQLLRGLMVVNQTLGRAPTPKEADAYVQLLSGLTRHRRIGGADLPRLSQLVRKDARIHEALHRAMFRQGLNAMARTALIGAALGLAFFGLAELQTQLAQELLAGNDRLVVPCLGATLGTYLGALGPGGWLVNDAIEVIGSLNNVKKMLDPSIAKVDVQAAHSASAKSHRSP